MNFNWMTLSLIAASLVLLASTGGIGLLVVVAPISLVIGYSATRSGSRTASHRG